jgi:hypothetical protein
MCGCKNKPHSAGKMKSSQFKENNNLNCVSEQWYLDLLESSNQLPDIADKHLLQGQIKSALNIYDKSCNMFEPTIKALKEKLLL